MGTGRVANVLGGKMNLLSAAFLCWIGWIGVCVRAVGYTGHVSYNETDEGDVGWTLFGLSVECLDHCGGYLTEPREGIRNCGGE